MGDEREGREHHQVQSPEKIWNDILKIKHPMPKMVFSVIGDSRRNFIPNPWNKSVFQEALIDSAQNAGDSWIIFRGYKDGVSKIIYDAYQNNFKTDFFDEKGELSDTYKKNRVRVKLIRIFMQKDENLQGPKTSEDTNRKLCQYTESSAREVKDYKGFSVEEILFKEGLDSEIDIADSTVNDESSFHEFLANLELIISKKSGTFFNMENDQSNDESISMKIPVMLVVVEGDLDTIKQTVLAVEKNIPVLLVKGSGKAADLIAIYMEREAKDKGTIQELAPMLFGISFNTKKMITLEEYLNSLNENRHMLHVFDVNLHDPQELSKIVGEAIVGAWAFGKMQEGSNAEQLDTDTVTTIQEDEAISFRGIEPDGNNFNYVNKFAKHDRPHVLKTKFLSPASLPLFFYVGYQVIQKNDNREAQSRIILLEALKSNRRDYVQALLEDGILLDYEDLPHLYKSTIDCENCGKDCLCISWVLRQSNKEAGECLCNEKDKTTPTIVKEKARFLVRTLLGYKEQRRPSSEAPAEDGTVEMHDLLLWSIFANRPDLSEIIWLLSDDHLMTALVCSALLKKLAKKEDNVKEQILSKKLTEHANIFSERCMKMLDELYDENPSSSMDIVGSEINIWDIKTTPLTFAHENFEMNFIGNTCPQKKLNQIWFNELTPALKPFFKSIITNPKSLITAPITRFLVNYFFFLLMLIAFSAFVMTSINDDLYRRPIARVWEYYIYIWAAGDLFEEINYGMGIFSSGGMSHRGYWSRLKRYLYDFWNAVDIISYIVLITAIIVRHGIEDSPYVHSRRLFSISLLIMYLRYLQVCLMEKRLGPTLLMIKEMLKDLLYFLVIALVVIIGTGIYYHANLYPNHVNLVGPGTIDTWHIWNIFYYPYWQLYGEIFNDFLEAKDQSNCSSDRSVYEVSTDLERCVEKDPTVPVVAAAYMLLSNLLLVNLVIAMFSYTFDSVMANSAILWRFERYTVIKNYEDKVPSPFNIIIRPIQYINKARKRCKCNRIKEWSEIDKEKGKKEKQMRHIQKIIANRISPSC